MAKKYAFEEDQRREYHQIRKRVLGGGKQTHTFKKWGRGTASGGGTVNVGMAFLTSDVSAAALGTDHITLGEGTANEFTRDDPDDPTSWAATGDGFTIYSKNPVLIRSGRAVTYQEVDGVKIINDKDCG